MNYSLNLKHFFSINYSKGQGFRYDISFLRVIAVLAVLLYHFNIFPARSGFVGVDIFFVISGFLMTKIILNGFEKGNFSLLEFYNKRLVRIFPALLVLLFTLIFIVYFLVPTQFINYLQSAFSSTMFFSNIYYFLNNGYFSSDAHNNFLLHTWSLSVEWQFYMIYPIILLLFRKLYFNNKKLFKTAFVLLLVVSFMSMMYHNISDYSYSFYIFYTRAWEMLFGGLALFYSQNLAKLSQNIKIVLVVVSYLILGICLVLFKSEFWPSYLTIVPVFFTAFIIALNVNFSILNNRKIKYLGDISYSLYLYHWPIYVLSKFYGVNFGFVNISALFFLSLIFAVLSYELIEKKSSLKQTKMILVTTACIFLFTFSLSFVNADNYLLKNGNLANVTTYYKNDIAPEQFNFNTGHFLDKKDFKNFSHKNLKIDAHRKNVVLLGDSHAGMFSKTFKNILLEKNINYIQITADGTYPMINSKSDLKGPIEYFNFVFNDFLKKNAEKIDLVVISSNYAAYDQSDLEEKINFTNQYFKKRNIKFLYLGQTKNYPIEYPTYFYMKKRYNVDYSGEDALFRKTEKINQFLIKTLSNNYINLLDYKVNTVSATNYPYIYDMNHLTFYGTELYKKLIITKINSAL